MAHMSDHNGWKVGVTPEKRDGKWTAYVEVWEPGMNRRTHPKGLTIPFGGRFDTEHEAQEAARRWAEQHIDKYLVPRAPKAK
jgi:hypothetical protein